MFGFLNDVIVSSRKCLKGIFGNEDTIGGFGKDALKEENGWQGRDIHMFCFFADPVFLLLRGFEKFLSPQFNLGFPVEPWQAQSCFMPQLREPAGMPD